MTYGSRMTVPSSAMSTTTAMPIATTIGPRRRGLRGTGGAVGGAGAIGTSGNGAVMQLRAGCRSVGAGYLRARPQRGRLLPRTRRRHELGVNHDPLRRAANGVAGENRQ